MNIIIS